MLRANDKVSAIKLSICITTLNRAAFIGETLQSILVQASSDCEVVVLDAASSDNTDEVVSQFARRFNQVRYIRDTVNNGIDRDYDRVVALANGEYCWLMTDDDVIKPGALAAVLKELRRDLSVLIVNVERRNLSLSRVVQSRWLDFKEDQVYAPNELDRLFVEVSSILMYIGCVVIKRSIWLKRERERYYGSWFIHVGIIFQESLPQGCVVIAQPFISQRLGNVKTFLPRVSEILFSRWPSVVETLAVSEGAKKCVFSARPWRSFQALLLYRALGYYSLTDFRRWIRPRLNSALKMLMPMFIAVLPGVLICAVFALYCLVTQRPYQGVWWPRMTLQFMGEGRFSVWARAAPPRKPLGTE